MSEPGLFGQLHIELAVHGEELGLWRQVSVLVRARVADDMPWELIRVLNDTGDRCVNFPSHFVQEVGHLDEKSA